MFVLMIQLLYTKKLDDCLLRNTYIYTLWMIVHFLGMIVYLVIFTLNDGSPSIVAHY